MATFTLRDSPPNFRLKGFHRHGFVSPQTSPLKDNTSCGNKRVARFIARGIDSIIASENEGFQYGTGLDYSSIVNKAKPQDKIVKINRERKEIEEELLKYKEKKDKENQERILEKKKDLEMLQDYYPWGGEGGGAPRFTKSGSVQAYRKKLDNHQAPASDDITANDGYSPFGKPGGGAPRRRVSGTIVSKVKIDPDTRFQKHLKKEVECSFRYKPTNNAAELQSSPLVLNQLIRTESEKQRKEKELQNKAIYAQQLERQIKEKQVIPIQSSFQLYFPWGQDQPNRNISGKLIANKKCLRGSGDDDDDDKSQFDVGGWLKGLGERKPNNNTPTAISNGANSSNVVYNPWGKPGCGAPLKNETGEKLATVFGNFEGKRKKVQDWEREDSGKVVSLT
jgi:hypothetical protein